MPVARPVSSDARVIAHVDMDCFYVQVEQRKQPELRGLPTAVVQYNEWKGGALIAVSYEARKLGVKRSMRGDEAKRICPQIQLVQVPVARGKADLSAYRNAGSEVVTILAMKGRCERASIDEAYLDLTDAAETMLAETPPESLEDMDEEALKSHIIGLTEEETTDVKKSVRNWLRRSDVDHKDKLLACGALIVAELRRQVLKETEFTCSAGIAHNKMLAKLASGMNKPAQQTVVPSTSVKEFLGSLPIKKMKQLGGKLGDSLQSDLQVNTVEDLLQFSEQKLQDRYGINTGTWLWNIARGISGEEVEGRVLPKSHGSGKTFPGPRALRSVDAVSHWLKQLCDELSERLLADLDQNKRIAHTLTLHVRAYKSNDTDSEKKFPSKSCQLRYGTSKIQEDAISLFHAGLREYMGVYGVNGGKKLNIGWGVTGLSVSASKILAIPQGTCTIMKFFPTQFVVSTASSHKTNSKSMHEDAQFSGGDGTTLSNMTTVNENTVKVHESGFHNKEMGKSPEDQELGSIARFIQEQGACSPFLDPATVTETLGLLRKESGSCSEVSKAGPPNKLHGPGEGSAVLLVSPIKKLQGRGMKESKGKTSILRFLKRSEPSLLEHDQNSVLQRNCPPSSPERNSQRRESWNYTIDEIDPTIIDELPPDIQEELRGWKRPMKQPHSLKRTITSYFPSMKSTG
uniref:DNA polymerase eta n=1 Tax=Opuntia streptacantha TaxID=393608 RepID=A0A7C8ZK03_OPUST